MATIEGQGVRGIPPMKWIYCEGKKCVEYKIMRTALRKRELG